MAAETKNGAVTGNRYGYRWKGVGPDGTKRTCYQRVTTIKGMKSSGDALIKWAVERNRLAIQAAAQEMGPTDELLVYLQNDANWTHHDRERDDAADFGTLFHDLVDQIAKENPNALDIIPKENERAWHDGEAFMRWCDKWKPKWVLNEFTVFNRTYCYAGTCDALVEIEGELWMIDLKTSKSINGDYALQLAAYSAAEFIGEPDGTETPMVPSRTLLLWHEDTPKESIAHHGILHVRNGQCNLHRMEVGRAQVEAFFACHRLYWWNREQPNPEIAYVDPGAVLMEAFA